MADAAEQVGRRRGDPGGEVLDVRGGTHRRGRLGWPSRAGRSSSVQPELKAAAVELLRHLLANDHEIVTLIEGEGQFCRRHPRRDGVAGRAPPQRGSARVHHGGQALYPYFIGIE